MGNQPVMYGEHTNVQCIAVFNGAEGAKPCSIVRISNLPDKSSPMECKHFPFFRAGFATQPSNDA